MIRRLLFLVALAGMAIGGHAQETSRPAQLKELDWMSGKWEGTLTWSAPDMTGESKVSYSTTTEGMFTKTVMSSTGNGQNMTETSYLGWDPQKRKYVSYTFASYAQTPRVEWSTWATPTLTSQSDPWMVMGRKLQSRAMYTKVDDKEMNLVIEFLDNGKWIKAGEGVLKKV